ncbi:MAG TPA: hypothetical protein DD979_02450 [Gammaproteobacteria bacterium]|nr:hypothetical protein [Gammaproteobacteria bacterium]
MTSMVSLFWFIASRIEKSLDESIEYSLPHIKILGLVGAIGFPMFYGIWHELFPHPYDNIGLSVVGFVTALTVTQMQRLEGKSRIYIRLFWLYVCAYCMSFFFTFLLLKNNCNIVWSMSAMAGLTLLVMVAHDWFLALLIHVIGSALAITAYFATTPDPVALELYLIQIPVYLFVIIAGGLFNYQSAKLRQAKLKAMASVGGELAHELRTPLLSIEHHARKARESVAELGLSSPSDPRRRLIDQSLQSNIREVTHANTIINMLLMDLGSRNLSKQQFDHHSIKTVIDSALARYPFGSAREKSKVFTRCSQDFTFFGSDVLLMHVIFNLLKNALAHLNDDGQILISTDSNGSANFLTIRDNGDGISARRLPHIFDEFYTSEGGGRGGTGIGLAFCRKVMRMFAGQIQCESQTGAFTQFQLSFPPVSASALESSLQKKCAEELRKLEGFDILFVDDEPEIIQRRLAELPEGKFSATIIDNAQDAMIHLKSNPCDMVVMDAIMPGMDGLTAIRLIRDGQFFHADQCRKHKTLPILAYSGCPDDNTQQQCIDAGATAFLSKDVSTLTFLRGLSQCITTAIENEQNSHPWHILKGKSILVIDDEDINCINVKYRLEPHGAKVHCEHSGASALRKMELEPFDAVIMDLHMPGIDGWETTEQIRSGATFSRFKHYATVPIIALSGDSRPELMSRCLQSGFNTLVLKPVDETLLLDTLSEYLSGAHSSETPTGTPADENEFQSTSIEQESKLIHDLLTPVLVLETGNELLEQHLPTLLARADTDNTMNSNLASAVEDTADVLSLIREKSQVFWKQAREVKSIDDKHHLAETFVRESRVLWKNVDTLYRQVLVPHLPSLISKTYGEGAYNNTNATASEIPKRALEKTQRDGQDAIEKAQTLIENYAAELTLDKEIL